MFKIVITTIVAATIYSTSYAHNENIPGPHGGRTQMPANFHTEVVSDKDGSFHIYLLDMEFQNPTVKNSTIKAYIVNDGKRKTSLKCNIMGDHFHCKSPRPISSGNLIVTANRNGTQATVDAKYELPLKPFDAKPDQAPLQMEDHSKHH